MLPWILPLCHLVGAFVAVRAIFVARSSQGAIAWALSLLFMPYFALPAWLFFGRSRFHGYVRARRTEDVMHAEAAAKLRDHADSLVADVDDAHGMFRAFRTLARVPFTRGNYAELLIDGEATFAAILAAIRKAEHYVLVEFYIVRDDTLGNEFKDALIERARAGVSVGFVFDEIGSRLPDRYLEECRAAGVDIRPFLSTRGPTNRFQINFRNHRKIVVVDGRVGFVGGHNVGDEYLGKDPDIGPWRDTHVRLEGPMVTELQLTFAEDWFWASKQVLKDLEWQPQLSARGDMAGLVIGSGPADELETGSLMFVQAIHGARQRCWIASPYFVPSAEQIAALQLAALRGVDVRILIPKNPDQKLVWLASFSYLELAAKTAVKFYRYSEGFMHHKVLLIDDTAMIGTADMDNRSFRLNFEVMAVVADRGFASQVAAMFERDFACSVEARHEELTHRGFLFRFAVRVARLLSPIL